MSMKLVGNKYLPDFYMFGNEFKTWADLSPEEKKFAYPHGKSEYSVNQRPLFKRFIEESDIVICKFGGSFNEKEFRYLAHRGVKMNKYLQWMIREAQGGSRGAVAWGYAYLAKENLVRKYLLEMGIWYEAIKLPKAKLVNRIKKFFGEYEDFPVKPRVKIIDAVPEEGLIFATPSYMKKHDIPFGCKTTWTTKGLLVPTVEDSDEYDILVPENENKFKLSAEKLANTMKIIRRLSPRFLYSKNLKRKFSDKLGRNPSQGFDISSLLCRTPKKEWLDEAKDIYHGRAEKEVIADALFSYQTKEGEKKHTLHGTRILGGESIHSTEIWPEAKKAIFTLVKKAMQPRLAGIYGVVMPFSLLMKYKKVEEADRLTGWLTRFPWTHPIGTVVCIWNDTIFVDDELWKQFGGDYDGDQGAVFEEKVMNTGLRWPRDRKFVEDNMKLPEKTDSGKDERSFIKVIADQLQQYQFCGQVYKRTKIVEENARHHGWSKRKIIALSMKMQATLVQPYIDGFKYFSKENKPPTVEEICVMFGVPTDDIDESKGYFNPLRGSQGGLDEVIDMSKKAKRSSKRMYEKSHTLLNDWDKIEIKREEVL